MQSPKDKKEIWASSRNSKYSIWFKQGVDRRLEESDIVDIGLSDTRILWSLNALCPLMASLGFGKCQLSIHNLDS